MEHQSSQHDRPFWLRLAVAWTLVVLLGIAIAMQISQNRRMAERIDDLQTSITKCNAERDPLLNDQVLLALLRDRDTRTIVLSDAKTPDAIEHLTATVWHNDKRGETALDINSLPRPNEGRYHQIWAIVNGTYKSMGMTAPDAETSWQSLPFIKGAQAFAISEERDPKGSTAPALVVMTGEVR